MQVPGTSIISQFFMKIPELGDIDYFAIFMKSPYSGTWMIVWFFMKIPELGEIDYFAIFYEIPVPGDISFFTVFH